MEDKCEKLLQNSYSNSNKEDCAIIPTRFTKIKEQIDDYRQQKRHKFNVFHKTARKEVFNENCTVYETSPKVIKHT